MNDLTPIEMDELRRLDEREDPRPRRRIGRLGWIVLVAAAVVLAWYLLRAVATPAWASASAAW